MERKKVLITSVSCFSHNAFKDPMHRGLEKSGLYDKGLIKEMGFI